MPLNTILRNPDICQHRSKCFRLALPKDGRFLERSLKAARVLSGNDFPKGLLYTTALKTNLKIYLLKSRDIAIMTSRGFIELGVSPDEWYLELQSRVRSRGIVNTEKLGWLSTNLTFFSAGNVTWPPPDNITVATSFRRIASNLLRDLSVKNYHVLQVTGAVEALVPDFAHLGFDCVETGETLKRHGLYPLTSAYEDLGVSLLVNRGFDVIEHESLFSQIVQVLKSVGNLTSNRRSKNENVQDDPN